ncbi:IS21 family transposase [Acidipropionibacterium acidipropionici]|uniref:Integrase n=1 Tax=Acidipropionibacterium acidipropionici TaxID=1748 RepID=A0A142KII2_9ACTN|nr:IS21 family transposase [Acidipropionibacterium acidipropionici]AMS05920.1 integrase [Acidipropionibacterium acidipropionici]AMS05927.1 integrase [Acidipropionibacterium acidipropionici]AMS06176.1 integrase [Acidipropionibacterium acidipropionici]AMS06387.1 integrase [Acidipropionibacterium acidipropionici]AOZ47383.1 integrase [Acidipropionibacterium acidipropionici]
MVNRIPAKRVLRLRAQGLSGRAIATSQGVARKSVAAVLEAADRLGVGWEDVAEREDGEVYALLFPGRGEHVSVFVQPDWAEVHRQLARVGVTLKLLHGEYADKVAATGGVAMSYDRFCRGYEHHIAVSGVDSRVGHKAGRTVEVDWSGPTMELIDPATGEVARVYLFVACLPFSRYAFVEPALDMRQPTWLRAHVAMFEFFGGSVPRIVCDNLKTGVISHPRDGEIVLNDAYRELAAHYSAAVLPGRVRRPKDKASVENTVGHVATVVIAALRDRTFTSLADLREAIRERVEAYNTAPFQKRPGSRSSVFTTEEEPLLRPLPAVTFEVSTWARRRRVGRDGHVTWARNHYSVPWTHAGEHVDLKLTASTLEVWSADQRLASHRLLPATAVNQYSTREADMPPGGGWQPWDQDRLIAWAGRIGTATTTVIEQIFASVPAADQGINPALAVLRLSHRYSAARLEAAARIGLKSGIGSPRYAHLNPILAAGHDRADDQATSQPEDPGAGFVRGASYYGGDQK